MTIDDLDTRMFALRTSASPPAIAELEARVLAGIADHGERRLAMRMTATAAFGALVIGLITPAMMAGNAASTAFDPIADATALAPSTLLEGATR